MDVKQRIKELREQIAALEDEIKKVILMCPHEHVVEKHYRDYDTNGYEIKCTDCGRVIFDGDYWQYINFIKVYGDKLHLL